MDQDPPQGARRGVEQMTALTKISIGGAPVAQAYADEIGADGYAPDAATAVDVARRLLSNPLETPTEWRLPCVH